MADKISIQFRMYSSDLGYLQTTQMDSANGLHVQYVVDLIKNKESTKEGIAYAASIGRKPITFCNLMIRRNGKLVSYKEFI